MKGPVGLTGETPSLLLSFLPHPKGEKSDGKTSPSAPEMAEEPWWRRVVNAEGESVAVEHPRTPQPAVPGYCVPNNHLGAALLLLSLAWKILHETKGWVHVSPVAPCQGTQPCIRGDRSDPCSVGSVPGILHTLHFSGLL